jgi:hypothetical protein
MKYREAAYPKMRSGCDMKSVILSSILLGSRTNVGKVTFERSIPTLYMNQYSSSCKSNGMLRRKIKRSSQQDTDLSCEIRDMIIEPSFSSLPKGGNQHLETRWRWHSATDKMEVSSGSEPSGALSSSFWPVNALNPEPPKIPIIVTWGWDQRIK